MLWGRVPVVSSAGDVVGERAAAAGAGHQRADRRRRSRGRRADRAALGSARAATPAVRPPAGLAAELAWPRVLAPLVAWLEHPHVAADRVSTRSWGVALRSVLDAARDAR